MAIFLCLVAATGVIPAVEAAGASQVLCQKEVNGCRLTLLASLPHAPFPYRGRVGDSNVPFFDGVDPDSGQPWHTVQGGVHYPEYPYYRDNRVLIHLPPTFKPGQPFAIVVFFHGHHTELLRTLRGEMALLEQVNASGRNVVLIAPQMALNAADSSLGKLYRPQGFKYLLDDVARVLKHHLGKRFAAKFGKAPVILVAYSGGYRAAAYTLDRGFAGKQELDGRLRGVILLDGLYGELDKFQSWLQRRRRRGFFVNLYTPSSQTLSLELEQSLRDRGRPYHTLLPREIKAGQIYSLAVATPHLDIPVVGPPQWPLAALLKIVQEPGTSPKLHTKR